MRYKNLLSLLLLPVILPAQVPPCSPLGQNLIINGDFEQGYYGFTSDFGRGQNNATRCSCATQGWILVTEIFPHYGYQCQGYPVNLSAQYGGPNTETSADPSHPSNTSVATLNVCPEPLPDHTTGEGLSLSIDPDACPDRVFWRQRLRVCPNSNYFFSVWVQNISGAIAPTFHFEVDGIPVYPPTVYPERFWQQTAILWNSGALDGVVNLELVNDLPGCIENDVAIDDIFMGICAGVTLGSQNLFRFCPDDPAVLISLTGSAVGFANPEYQWQQQVNGVWENLPGAKDTLLQIAAPSTAAAGWYRLAAAEQGNLDAFTCSVYSPLIRLEAYPAYILTDTVMICQGQSFQGYSETGIYEQIYQTQHGCDSIERLDLRVRGDLRWYVPNVFRPNAGSPNDRFQVFLSDTDIDVFLMQVYDRWGSLVFESKTPEVAWEGRCGRKECADGVYFYRLVLDVHGCQRSEIFGDVTLLR